MPIQHLLVSLVLISSLSVLKAQTELFPGDIFVLSMSANMGGCGLPANSDEISFVCFKDIETGTQFEITDNGWEAVNTGFWGDAEGVLSITRTGPTIPKGTVLVFQAIATGPGFNYKFNYPDNGWTITNINIPGGPFNLETGGDQIFWWQGGTWDNQGGGINRGLYDGKVIFMANMKDTWVADGTVGQSNAYPDLSPCYVYTESAGSFYHGNMEYFGPSDGTDYFTWMDRLQNPNLWYVFQFCSEMEATNPPDWSSGSIEIIDDFDLTCGFCGGCSPYNDGLTFQLPPGVYNLAYTDGVDTFYMDNVTDNTSITVTIYDTTVYTLLWVERLDTGCRAYPNASVTYPGVWHDPGLHNELWICPTFHGPIMLFNYLNGTPETGGTWTPALAFNIWYYGEFGPGRYLYSIPKPGCPPDTATVRIYPVDLSNTEVEISCDQNGTPNDIYDDVTVINLNVIGGPHFYDDYDITISAGTITPAVGTANTISTFHLQPGSAIGNPVNITVLGHTPFLCPYTLTIPPPGYCSDPCDPDMIAGVEGPDDLCLKNCPDNPGTIAVQVEGGTAPYKMDFQLNAPGYPTWSFNNVPITDFYEIQVCIDAVASPQFDANSHTLVLPNFLGDSEITFTLANVYDKFDCLSQLSPAEHTIFIHKLPVITTTTLNYCWEEAKTVNLTDFDLLISLFLDVTWWDGDPFQGGEQLFTTTSVNLHNVNQLWARVEDDYCANAIQVPFTIHPTPRLDTVPDIHVCEGTPIVLGLIPLTDAANSMATYSYHSALPPDTSNLLDPLYYLPIASDTIYVHATAGMCHDTLPIIVIVEPYPIFSLEGQPCDLLTDTYSLLFTTSADSIAANAGTITNNPTGQDKITGIPENVNITLLLWNDSHLCKDTFSLIAPNCNCPQINQPLTPQNNYAVCEENPLPQLSVTIDPGLVANWYDVPSGGVALLQNSLTFQPVNPVNATYYVEALDQTNGCYSLRTSISIAINPLAVLQPLVDPVLCEGETLNFNTLAPNVLNGISGSGNWFSLPLNTPVSGILQPTDGNSWYYRFLTTAGSCPSADTIKAAVNPLPTIDVFNIECFDATLLYNLEFTSDADVIIATAGTLNQIAGTDSFSLVDIAFDTDITFDLQNTATGCSSTTAQAAPDCSCPPLLDNTSTTICSSGGILNLSTFVGPGVNGAWQLISTPPGVSPATLTGANFNGANGDAGAYKLRFIRSIILDDCVDTALFDLQLVKAPTADAGTNGAVCAPDAIALNGTVTGTGAIFSWQETGAASIANPNALNTSYLPTQGDITAGSVSFTLNAVDPSGTCPNAQETITINIDDRAYYILNAPAQTYCDTTDIQVDLNTLISFGVTSGQWFFPDTVNAPISGNSIINPSTIPAGNYTIFYTSTTAVAPCKNDTTGVNLIIRNCACPSVALSTPVDALCSETGNVNLNTFLITTEQGTWSISAKPGGTKPATIAGTTFTTNFSDPGTYTIRYTLSNPVAGCDPFAEVNLVVLPTPILSVASISCASDLQSWEAVIQSTSSTVSISQGTLNALPNNKYEVKNIALNTSLIFTATTANGLCEKKLFISAPDCNCTLAISNLPDNVNLCPEDNITLEAEVDNGRGPVTSFWIVNNDSLYQLTLIVNQAGTYEFVSIDSLGCRDEHLVNVNYYQEMTPDFSTQDVQCPGDHDGIIFLNAINGGNGPFFITVNNGVSQAINAFPYSIEDLNAGQYQIEIQDAFSCEISFNVTIASASTETISLGPDQSILVGDSILIHPLLSFVPDSFYWTGDIALLDPLALDNQIHPQENVSVELFALDEKGCLYHDDLTIKVLLNSSIYVPTVFSPNDDGINDLLKPEGDPSITQFTVFAVYNRWGELVFEAKDFAPGDNTSWNGTFHDQKLLPAVFVYKVIAVNKRGKILTKYGDVTIVK